MRSFTADHAKRKFGAILKAAGEAPVAISRHGRRAYVLMPARLFDLYESLREANEEERIHEAAESAVTDYLAGDSRPAARVLGEAHAPLREVVGRAQRD